jgi:hypothetical protein
MNAAPSERAPTALKVRPWNECITQSEGPVSGLNAPPSPRDPTAIKVRVGGRTN